MSNLYDIGRTGLQSYRQSLAITGQNIANVNTEGYKRRGADLEELSAQKGSTLDIGMNAGMGVRITQMNRAFDEFLLNKARSASAFAQSSSAYVTAAKQIENIMVPGDANLGKLHRQVV
jgi:flagellar hook-associated protein 1 FlgK